MAGDAGVATFLALGGLLQDDDFGSEVVRRDGGGDPGRTKSDDDDVGFYVPFMRH